ncbi:MAG: GntR family transcriptional regulator [Planctomycetota bacterium]
MVEEVRKLTRSQQDYGPDAVMTLDRRSLAEKVFEHIKAGILSGDLIGGERIVEEQIASTLGVSRTPIREALRRLEEYGLVRVKRRSRVEVVKLTEQEAAGVIEVRAALEKLAAELLAGRAREEDVGVLREMDAACRNSLEENNFGVEFEADSLFHIEIARRGGNAALYETMLRLDGKVQLVRLMRCKKRENIARDVAVHEKIIQAIESGDTDAAGSCAAQHVLKSGGNE